MSLDFDALVLAPCHATFGEVNRGFPTPQYQPQAGGGPFSIDGVFRIPSDDILAIGDAPGITTRLPEVDFRLSLFPSGTVPTQGDIVQIRSVYYFVADVRIDGNGLATLWLRESPLSAPEIYSTMLRIELGTSATWAPLLTQNTSTTFTLAAGQVGQQSISITDNLGTAGADPITVGGSFNVGSRIIFSQAYQSFDSYWDAVNLVWVVT